MGASQLYEQMERAAELRGTTRRGETRPWSTAWLSEQTGATYRQLDYWIGKGLLGRGHRGGSGSQRRFTPAEFELVAALAQLAALGGREHWLELAADAVRAARVNAAGERLVLLLDGTCFRHPSGQPVSAQGPGWIIPLAPCPFSPAGVPLPHCNVPAGDRSRGSA